MQVLSCNVVDIMNVELSISMVEYIILCNIIRNENSLSIVDGFMLWKIFADVASIYCILK